MRACGDFHSNETVWPWYSRIFPASIRIANDVDEGRTKLNVSEWGMHEFKSGEAAEIFQEGEMPPVGYLIIDPEARLTPAAKRELLSGMIATFGGGDKRYLVVGWVRLAKPPYPSKCVFGRA
jgi:hypothetical protein